MHKVSEKEGRKGLGKVALSFIYIYLFIYFSSHFVFLGISMQLNCKVIHAQKVPILSPFP